MPDQSNMPKNIQFIELQFNTLRDEILSLKARVSRILIAALSGIPIIIATGDKLKLDFLIITAPIITAVAMFLILSEQNGIMRAGRYIRKHLEPKIKQQNILGWEEYLESEEINRSCERYLLVSVVTVFSVYYIGSSLLAYLTIQTKYGLKYANFLLLIYLSATLFFVYFIIRNFQIRSSFKK